MEWPNENYTKYTHEFRTKVLKFPKHYMPHLNIPLHYKVGWDEKQNLKQLASFVNLINLGMY